jgi:hypothetical protein
MLKDVAMAGERHRAVAADRYPRVRREGRCLRLRLLLGITEPEADE